MELEFSIELEQTAVVVGEDILIKFRLTNRSDRSMTIPNPRLSADWPQLCLTNATSRQERISSRSTVSARQSSDFMVPLPEPILTLEPKQSIETSALMSQLAVLPSPGKYEIKALLKWEQDRHAESNTLSLTVEALHAVSVQTFGAQSGLDPDRFLLYAVQTNGGTALFLSGMQQREHAPPLVEQGTRIGALAKGSEASVSVTAQSITWPAQWILWLDKGELSGEYLMQWSVQVPPSSHALGIDHVRMIAPAYLDLDHAEGLKPAPGIVALVGNIGGKLHAIIKTITSDGTLKNGPVMPLEQGNFKWGKAAYLKENLARYVMAIGRRDGVDLQVVSRRAEGEFSQPITVGHLKGEHLASNLCITSDDDLVGLSVMQESSPKGEAMSRIYRWSIDGTGNVETKQPILLSYSTPLHFVQAIPSVNPKGALRVLLASTDQAWYSANETGKCSRIGDATLRNGVPAGIYWLEDQTPFILHANPDRGFLYSRLEP